MSAAGAASIVRHKSKANVVLAAAEDNSKSYVLFRCVGAQYAFFALVVFAFQHMYSEQDTRQYAEILVHVVPNLIFLFIYLLTNLFKNSTLPLLFDHCIQGG